MLLGQNARRYKSPVSTSLLQKSRVWLIDHADVLSLSFSIAILRWWTVKAAKGRFFLWGKSCCLFSTERCCVTFLILRKLPLHLVQCEVYQQQSKAEFLGFHLRLPVFLLNMPSLRAGLISGTALCVLRLGLELQISSLVAVITSLCLPNRLFMKLLWILYL